MIIGNGAVLVTELLVGEVAHEAGTDVMFRDHVGMIADLLKETTETGGGTRKTEMM